MGTSHSAISRIAAGQHRSSVATLDRLASALETHLVIGFADDPAGTDAVESSRQTHPTDLVALS